MRESLPAAYVPAVVPTAGTAGVPCVWSPREYVPAEPAPDDCPYDVSPVTVSAGVPLPPPPPDGVCHVADDVDVAVGTCPTAGVPDTATPLMRATAGFG